VVLAVLQAVLLLVCSLPASARTIWTYTEIQRPIGAELAVLPTFDGPSGYPSRIRELQVTIANHSERLVAIQWDLSVLVLPEGVSERVIHTGVRYVEQGKPQAPTAIAPQSRADEVIWPASYCSASDDGWVHLPILIDDGDVVKLYLVWEQDGEQRGEQWAWRFESTVEQEEPREFDWGTTLTWVIVLGSLVILGTILQFLGLTE